MQRFDFRRVRFHRGNIPSFEAVLTRVIARVWVYFCILVFVLAPKRRWFYEKYLHFESWTAVVLVAVHCCISNTVQVWWRSVPLGTWHGLDTWLELPKHRSFTIVYIVVYEFHILNSPTFERPMYFWGSAWTVQKDYCRRLDQGAMFE